MKAKCTGVRPMIEELKDHNSDGACFLLYRSLLAPTDLLKHWISVVDRSIQSKDFYFQLIQRGSLARGTALRYDNDIDLDIILPRSLFSFDGQITAEKIQKWNKELPLESLCDVFQDLEEEENGSGPDSVVFVVDNWRKMEITRSIKCKLRLDGVSHVVNVDLFPKYISNDGQIMSLGPKKKNGDRDVLFVDPLVRSEVSEFTDEELAAVVFMKLWNKQYSRDLEKRNKTVKSDPLENHIKSFHINIAVEKREKEKRENRESAVVDAFPGDAENSSSNIAFKFENVVHIMLSAINKLVYFYENSSDALVQVDACEVPLCTNRLRVLEEDLISVL